MNDLELFKVEHIRFKTPSTKCHEENINSPGLHMIKEFLSFKLGSNEIGKENEISSSRRFKTLRKIQSVNFSDSSKELSFIKKIKRKGFMNRADTCKFHNKFDELKETSLERKLKYFYSPYNKLNNLNKCMKFELDHPDSEDLIRSTKIKVGIKSQWKNLSKIIFQKDSNFFQRIIKSMRKKGFRRPAFISPNKHYDFYSHGSSKKLICEQNHLTNCELNEHEDLYQGANSHLSEHQYENKNSDESQNSKKIGFSNCFTSIIRKSKCRNIGKLSKFKAIKRKPKIMISKISTSNCDQMQLKSTEASEFRHTQREINQSRKENINGIIKTYDFKELKEINSDSEKFTRLITKRPNTVPFTGAHILNKCFPRDIKTKNDDKKCSEYQHNEPNIRITSPKLRTKRYISPNERLRSAYSPNVGKRDFKIKYLSSKLCSPVRKNLLSAKKSKPSSNTVTTNSTSVAFVNSCKSISLSPQI